MMWIKLRRHRSWINGVEVIIEAREGSGESSEIILKPLLPVHKLLVLL
jgi:hypothetical protein